ncbi:hypothetical protein HanXRQr2_Chr14g0626841 [Helianthus annuus]|uniref:Uncharacterized protein n=1 Tax=Helianthus annuus TaxID=4232 RepID=A0A9K3E823_HELAN|nr:hypothetical protein HanXRQr2_Chr14g0626841 [Helianthus annuus]KAJ0839003.1 hypothetical protein HanPSC8_Chr14g0601621 [Helianthus annuus]
MYTIITRIDLRSQLVSSFLLNHITFIHLLSRDNSIHFILLIHYMLSFILFTMRHPKHFHCYHYC